MHNRAANQQKPKVKHNLKDFTLFPAKGEASLKKELETKSYEQPFIRRRYSFENSTGSGYQGL